MLRQWQLGSSIPLQWRLSPLLSFPIPPPPSFSCHLLTKKSDHTGWLDPPLLCGQSAGLLHQVQWLYGSLQSGIIWSEVTVNSYLAQKGGGGGSSYRYDYVIACPLANGCSCSLGSGSSPVHQTVVQLRGLVEFRGWGTVTPTDREGWVKGLRAWTVGWACTKDGWVRSGGVSGWECALRAWDN